MKNKISSLVLVSFVTVSTLGHSKRAEGKNFTLPAILLILGIGGILWGRSQNKKSKEAIAKAEAAAKEAQKPVAPIRPLSLDTDGHPYNRTSKEVNDEETESKEVGPQGFAKKLVTETAKLQAFRFSKFDEAIPEGTHRSLAGDQDYEDRAKADNIHIFLALREAGCNLSDLTPENRHKTEAWKKYFEILATKNWEKVDEGLKTEDFLKKTDQYAPGSVVVYDCSDSEAALNPIVEVLGSQRESGKARDLMARQSLPADWHNPRSKCSKIVAVYTPPAKAEKCVE